jgi:hypothetical protein
MLTTALWVKVRALVDTAITASWSVCFNAKCKARRVYYAASEKWRWTTLPHALLNFFFRQMTAWLMLNTREN